MSHVQSAPPQNEALHEASRNGDVDEVKRMISAGAGLNYRNPRRGYTDALKEAIMNGHIEIVRLLLDAGADPTVIDIGGSTSYTVAAKRTKPLGGLRGQTIPPKPAAAQIAALLKSHEQPWAMHAYGSSICDEHPCLVMQNML